MRTRTDHCGGMLNAPQADALRKQREGFTPLPEENAASSQQENIELQDSKKHAGWQDRCHDTA